MHSTDGNELEFHEAFLVFARSRKEESDHLHLGFHSSKCK